MGKYDNFSNIKNIQKVQKKLDRLMRKRKPDLFKIDLVQEELNTAKLFESCQIFKAFHGEAPNERVLFSDDNRVMLFGGRLIKYKDIASYKIVEKFVSSCNSGSKAKDVISGAIAGHIIAGSVGAVVGSILAEADSETTCHQYGDGFEFQVFLKNGNGYALEVSNIGVFTNRIHPKWIELGKKIQRIIDG